MKSVHLDRKLPLLAFFALATILATALLYAHGISGGFVFDDYANLPSLGAQGPIDNLPAYLAFEQVADSPARIAALLIGVNAGPLVTPWASLAVLLWHDRLHALGVEFSWRRYMLLGLVAAPLTVVAATVALWLTI